MINNNYDIKKNMLLRRCYNCYNPFAGEILMLHRVTSERSNIQDNRMLEIRPEFLEKTIIKYKEAGYLFLSLDDVLKTHKRIMRPKKKYVCFTLDDGYYDNLSAAFPVFLKYQVPFIIYITTDFVDQNAFLWWYVLENIIQNNEEVKLRNGISYSCKDSEEKNNLFKLLKKKFQQFPEVTKDSFFQYLDEDYKNKNFIQPEILNWDNITSLLDNNLCSIGSHGVTHTSLTKASQKTLEYELCESKKIIEDKLKTSIIHFAYPYGDLNAEVVKAVKKAGYSTAVRIDGGMQRKHQNHYLFKRLWLTE